MTKKKKAIIGYKIKQQTDKSIFHAVRGEFYEAISEVLRSAQSKTFRAVNFIMVEAYWNVGRMIVEEEQQGKERAKYGQVLIKNLSHRLTNEFGEGFSEQSLRNFRQFYLSFPIRSTLWSESANDDQKDKKSSIIPSALRRELTWSHYRALLRVEKPDAREYMPNEKELIVREQGERYGI